MSSLGPAAIVVDRFGVKASPVTDPRVLDAYPEANSGRRHTPTSAGSWGRVRPVCAASSSTGETEQ